MKEHYVTLFDSVFLPQGLALHHSLLEHGGDCLLWVLCLDENCLSVLQRLDLPQMRLLDLEKLETHELLHVKPSRTRAEYCWTLTPWSIQWVFEADSSAKRVTYLDADVFFLKSAAPIFDQFDDSGCDFLITEHGFAPEYDVTPTFGRYCVQFVPVVRGAGEPLLHWWRDRCIEWCFSAPEDGLFGDQKYIEQLEYLFPGKVYATRADRRFQAPWNCSIFPFSDAVLFHFQGLKILNTSVIRATSEDYILPTPTLEYIYKPYCTLLISLAYRYSLVIAPQACEPSLHVSWRLRLFKWISIKLKLPAELPYLYMLNHGSIDDRLLWKLRKHLR